MPRRVENGAKMAPKWLPGGLWAPTLLPEARRRPLERLWGGSWGRRGASWGAPGASWAAPGAHFGSPGASFWSFLALREVILEGVFATGACNAKNDKKCDFQHVGEAFLAWFLCRFLRLAGGAGARAHLEKTANGVEGVALFACRPFARGAKKMTKDDEKLRKTQLENASKNERRSTREKHFLKKE